MTGTGISISVNRVFTVIGALFLFGGIYYGPLLYLDPDRSGEIITVTGKIETLRTERVRPLGFENIPVDSEDPEHAHIPVNTNLFAHVSYSYEGITYEGDIVSWNEPREWKVGGSVNLYLVSGEYDIPLDYYPFEFGNGKRDVLMVGFGLSGAGLVLLAVGLFSSRSEKIKSRERAEQAREQKIRQAVIASQAKGPVLDVTNRGNPLAGGILLVLGIILLVSMAITIGKGSTLYDQLLLGFPLLLGAGLIYLGLGEWARKRITIEDGSVRVRRYFLKKRMDRTAGLNSFDGIGVNRYVRHHSSGLGRYYKELVLLHGDPDFNELSIARIAGNEEGRREAQELAERLGLVLVFTDTPENW